MAESEFKQYQDADSDGKHDLCAETTYPSLSPEPCPSCVPNPDAIVPNWIEQTEPFLNPKTCEYSVTIVTNYSGTGGDELEERLSDSDYFYLDQGIEKLLRFYNKLESRAGDWDYDDPDTGETITSDETGTIEAARLVATIADYHLGGDSVIPRTKATVKFLVVIPAVNFDQFPDSAGDSETSPASDVTDSNSFVESVELETRKIKGDSRKIGRLLERYTAYHKIYSQFESGKIVFENGAPWNGVTYANRLRDAINELFDFIKGKNYKIPGPVPKTGIGRQFADRIKFGFTPDAFGNIALNYITIIQNGCEDAARTFTCSKELSKGLLASVDSAWNDPTVLGYVSRMSEMSDIAQAREPMPWKDFVIEYTQPEVSISHEHNADKFSSCAGGDLNASGKDAVEDFLSGVIDFSDIFVYKFVQASCKKVEDKDQSNPDVTLSTAQRNDIRTKIFDEQAMKQYSAQMTACKDLPGLIKIASSKEGKSIDNFWADIADKLRNCGMYSVMFEAISCLMGGLSLEAALGKLLETAFRNMSAVNMEIMWAGLSYEKKNEINAKLIEIYGSEDKPWFDKYVAATDPHKIQTRGTLGDQSSETADAVLNAYIEAIFQVHAAVDRVKSIPGTRNYSKSIGSN